MDPKNRDVTDQEVLPIVFTKISVFRKEHSERSGSQTKLEQLQGDQEDGR